MVAIGSVTLKLGWRELVADLRRTADAIETSHATAEGFVSKEQFEASEAERPVAKLFDGTDARTDHAARMSLPGLVTVRVGSNGITHLLVDGEHFPWHIEPGFVVDAGCDQIARLTVTILADRLLFESVDEDLHYDHGKPDKAS